MKKLLAVTFALAGSAGAASAQLFAPPQPMPSQVVPASGNLTAPYGTVVPAGSFNPAVTGGVVTGQPYYPNQSVLGGTVVGMPRVTGNPYPQPFTTYNTGNSVVGGSVMANGSIPYTTFSPTTTPNGVAYPANVTYPQQMGTMSGNQVIYTSAPVTYTSVPYSGYPTMSVPQQGFASSGGSGSGSMFSGVLQPVQQVIAVPGRVVRRVFRR